MHRHSYTYSYPTAGTKVASNHAVHASSATSASANPNEDWTRISDLAERRRIQNRIAQRNYRKKLKRRLEDLERRANSSPSSPPESVEGQSSTSTNTTSDRTGDSIRVVPDRSETGMYSRNPSQDMSYMPPNDDRNAMFSHQYTRQLSTSPPPFAYSYPAPDYIMYPSYTTPSHTTPVTAVDFPTQDNYLPPIPTTLPSMINPHSPPMKYEGYLTEEDLSQPFSLGYGAVTGIDMASHGYQDPSPHVMLPHESVLLIR